MMFDLILDALLPFVLLANSEKDMGYFTFVTYSRVMKEPLKFHPNSSMNILPTVLYTFPKVLTRRICLTITSFIFWLSIPLFSRP